MPGFLAAMLPALASAGVSAIAQGGPRRQYKWNKRAAQDTYEMNRKIQQEQRIYDSPKAAMGRFLEAGLNPNMIYGSGSAGSGGAFPFSYHVAPPSAQYPDVAQSYLQAGQTMAQTGYLGARTSESNVSQALKQVQIDIARTNPMLNPDVAARVAEQLESTALLKAREAQYMKSHWYEDTTPEGMARSRRLYVVKIESEVEAMVQKLGLNTEDLAIKNQILESKEFENMMKEVQAKWLQDADISPEHIRQGLMLILGKMVGR